MEWLKRNSRRASAAALVAGIAMCTQTACEVDKGFTAEGTVVATGLDEYYDSLPNVKVGKFIVRSGDNDVLTWLKGDDTYNPHRSDNTEVVYQTYKDCVDPHSPEGMVLDQNGKPEALRDLHPGDPVRISGKIEFTHYLCGAIGGGLAEIPVFVTIQETR